MSQHSSENRFAGMARVPTLLLIWQMVRYRPWVCFLHATFFMLNVLVPLALGLIIRRLFDMLSRHATAGPSLWSLIALLFGASLTRAILVVMGAKVDMLRAFLMVSLLRRNILGRLLCLPGAAALKHPVGEVVSRLREDPDLVEDVLSNIPDFAGAVLSFAGAVLILAQIDSRLTFYVFLPLCFIVAAAQAAGHKFEQYRRASREATGQVTAAIGEAFASVEAIQLSRAENTAAEHIGALSELRRKAVLRDSALALTLESLEAGTATIGTGVLLLLASGSVASGAFSVGDLSLFASYLTVVADNSVYVGSFMASLRHTSVAFVRMAELLFGAPPEALVAHSALYFSGQPGPEEQPSAEMTHKSADQDGRAEEGIQHLSAANLTYRYPATGNGISGADFDVPGHALTLVAGRVGSGKTTLVRALLGLLPASDGQVFWNGQPVADTAAFFTPPVSSYACQVPVLLGDSIRRNILLGMADGEHLQRAIGLAVLESELSAMHEGLETVTGSRGARLSGGQAQRMAVARAFARNTMLVVLDDPTSALDHSTEEAFWHGVREEVSRHGLTCLAVSNSRAALQRADHIILLQGGRVSDQGTLDVLLGRSPEMRLIWCGNVGSNRNSA